VSVIGRAIVLGLALLAEESAMPGRVLAEKPVKVAVCTLQASPAAYNHKLIEVSGLVSYGFEQFSHSDTRCAKGLGVWLEYGGTTKSGAVYCCGVTGDRARAESLVVEGISVPLIQDAIFRRFDTRIRTDGKMRATLIGRFFAGRDEPSEAGVSLRGYGHLGCCSLLAIQQVLAIDPADGRGPRR
jgi:hypothetical protein